MQTQLRVEGANCTYCMSDVIEALLIRPDVTAVQTSAVPGCVVIEHDDADVVVLKALIKGVLHGYETASNGEIIMTTTTVETATACPRHGPEDLPARAGR